MPFKCVCPNCKNTLSLEQLKLLEERSLKMLNPKENINKYETGEILYVKCPVCGEEVSYSLVRTKELSAVSDEDVEQEIKKAIEVLELADLDPNECKESIMKGVLIRFGLRNKYLTAQKVREILNRLLSCSTKN